MITTSTKALAHYLIQIINGKNEIINGRFIRKSLSYLNQNTLIKTIKIYTETNSVNGASIRVRASSIILLHRRLINVLS